MGIMSNSDEVDGGGRVRVNVGGGIFESTRRTLLCSKLIASKLKEGDSYGEVFIDRDPALFPYVLNFLRNGDLENALCVAGKYSGDENLLNALMEEGEFYGVVELVAACKLMSKPLRPQDAVRWRPDGIEYYWKLFVKSIVDKGLQLPFTFERNSHFCAKCIACDEMFDPKTSNIYEINLDEWGALAHHMRSIEGRVQRVVGTSCVIVRWDNAVLTHLPQTAVMKAFISKPKPE